MLIGIDMLGVQALGAGGRPSGRFGRQLVAALLAGDPSAEFLLYAHEGLPVGAIPAGRNARRVGLSPVEGRGCPRRAAVQRLLDRDPDGLDWLILLDPFLAGYGGVAPESPIRGPRVASVVLDPARGLVEDRKLGPLRRHEVVLAATSAAADDWRRRLGISAGRVVPIGLAVDAPFSAPDPSEPLSRVSGDELGRLGIRGPYVLACPADGAGLADLSTILGAYRLLPIDRRARHQLVIAGAIHDPAGVRSAFRDQGADDGLVLAGDLPEAALASLLGRCSAFLAPDGSPALPALEAIRCGAPVISGRSPALAEVLDDAALVVDESDPAAFASDLDDLLLDPGLAAEVRLRSRARSDRFRFGPVADAVLSTLRASSEGTSTRLRADRGHSPRPRLAVFPAVTRGGTGRLDLVAEVPTGWGVAFAVDLYLEPGDSSRVDGLPPEFGGFDARLFGRNDELLGYDAVLYRVGDESGLISVLGRLRGRPGLVMLLDGDWLDRIGLDDGPESPEARLREVFASGSRVVVHSPRHLDAIVSALPEFADRVAVLPPEPAAPGREGLRARSRDRLDLMPGALVIGQFGGPAAPSGSLMTPRAFLAVARLVPEVILLSFDTDLISVDARREAEALGIADRFVHVGPVGPGDVRELIAVLDLAIHPGRSGSPTVLDLLKAGVPTIALDRSFPDSVVRNVAPSPRGGELARAVRELALDARARDALGRSALAYCVGIPDEERASALLLGEVERCAAEVPRGPGRRPLPSKGPRALSFPIPDRSARPIGGGAEPSSR